MSRVQLEKDYWDRAALDPDVDRKYISDISTEQCIEALELSDDVLYIAEIGCGVGRISNQIGAVGVDISQNMIDIARKNECFEGQYEVSNGRTIPLPSDNYEFVYSVLLFQHLEGTTILGYMQETYRILKPGGIFRFQYIPGTENEPFSKHYDTRQMRKWLQVAGLKFIKEDKGLCHPLWSWITAKKP